jgi:hypothetical protein
MVRPTTKRLKVFVSDDESSRGSDSDQYASMSSHHHERQWTDKFQELKTFKEQHGHCRVPHTFNEIQGLARWVKRQRYQHKLRNQGQKTTITESRVNDLEDLGFVWDSHSAAWEERVRELQDFRTLNGNTNVTGKYPENPQLSTWVKCQRRQYKLYLDGKPSNISASRINDFEQLGFEWTVRPGSSYY